MWYFAWVLGIGFAVLLSILNAMWHEAQEDQKIIADTANKSVPSDARRAA
jgi:cytochrome bd-I ubiquinol oxidase subunit X